MQIIEKLVVDSAGRINISKLFDEIPKEVLVLYDTNERIIVFKDDFGDGWQRFQRKVDSRNRVVLPKWVRESLGDVYYVVPDSTEKHCLLAEEPLF